MDYNSVANAFTSRFGTDHIPFKPEMRIYVEHPTIEDARDFESKINSFNAEKEIAESEKLYPTALYKGDDGVNFPHRVEVEIIDTNAAHEMLNHVFGAEQGMRWQNLVESSRNDFFHSNITIP